MLSRASKIRTCWLSAVALAMFSCLNPLLAQDSKPKTSPPFLVVSVTSVDRLMSDIAYMFESADRPELSELVGGALSNVRDLKGLKRDKALGFMLFLNGLVPEPVGFVPVDNMEELAKTAQIGPITTNKVSDDMWEIMGPRQKLYARLLNGYAFIGRSEEAVNRDFDNPANLTKRLASTYDIALSLNTRAVPKTTRQMILDFLRAQSEASIQQRDDEPDAAYRIRRAAEEGNLENMDIFINQAEELTIGMAVRPEDKEAFLEFVVTADPKTDYAKQLNDLNATRSKFGAMHKNAAPFTFSSAVKLDPPSQRTMLEVLSVGSEEIIKALAPKSEQESSPIADFFASLKSTVKEGKFDVVVQMLGDAPGPFTLVGAVKVADSDKLQRGLTEILERIKGRDELQLESVSIGAAEHRGVTLHRLQGKAAQEEGSIRLLGKDAGLYVGAGNGTLWFAIGGEDALPTLRRQIDAVSDSSGETPVIPMQLVFHTASWLWLADQGDGQNPVVDLFRESFAQGHDAVRIEVMPIQDGAKFRLTAEEGFVRLLGKAIGRRVDGN